MPANRRELPPAPRSTDELLVVLIGATWDLHDALDPPKAEKPMQEPAAKPERAPAPETPVQEPASEPTDEPVTEPARKRTRTRTRTT